MGRTRILTRSRTLARTLVASLLFALVLPAAALADTATPERPASPGSHAINDVYFAILGVTVTIFVLVGGWLLYSAIRFRARPGDPLIPPQIHGSNRLEIGWTIVPVLILVAISGYTISKIPDVQDSPDGAKVVKVEGFQFGWSFKGTNGFTLPKDAPANTLVIPVDTAIKLDLTSRDVIHDFWVPSLGAKRDLWPGATTSTWIQADRIGVYEGQCAEFCGVGHATMLITVRVVSKSDFTKMGGEGV
jgi:cytochrome c oxidase subunit II